MDIVRTSEVGGPLGLLFDVVAHACTAQLCILAINLLESRHPRCKYNRAENLHHLVAEAKDRVAVDVFRRIIRPRCQSHHGKREGQGAILT
eukprot:2031652-Amphidinium_carterae.1